MARKRLSADLAYTLRQSAAQGTSPRRLAEDHGISLSSVYRILGGAQYPDAIGSVRARRPRLPPQAGEHELLAAARSRLQYGSEVTASGCWLYAGGGSIRIGGKHYRLARLSFLAYVGPVPDGLVVVHICDRAQDGESVTSSGAAPRCWRPDHLRLASPGRRASSPQSPERGTALSCPRGHCYSVDNTRFRLTRIGTVTRACRTCAREARRRSPAR